MVLKAQEFRLQEDTLLLLIALNLEAHDVAMQLSIGI